MRRIQIILASPDVIARTFREVQARAGEEKAELVGRKDRLEARLAELRRAIGRLARSDGSDGALASELRGLNEELAEVQSRLAETRQAEHALTHDGPSENEVSKALRQFVPLWDELFPAEKQRIVRLLVAEVVVGTDALLIRLRLNGLNSLVGELQGDSTNEGDRPPEGTSQAELGNSGQTVDIRVPMQLRTRAGRKEIVLPTDAATTADVGPRSPLVVALARAYHWQRMIDSGEVPGVEAIAARLGLDRTYVSRMLPLTSLAPDIIEAILRADEPDGLSLEKLRKNLPVRWDEQRR